VNGTLTVNKAALTVTANTPAAKTYGTLVTFAGTEFTTAGLVNADTVTSVTLTSAGAAAAATVAGSPYSIVPSAAAGTGLANYTITYVNGTLMVNAKALTVTANNASKTYGATLTFAGTEFTSSGLVNADTVTSVTLTSAGAVATATAGSYSIVPSAAVGTGLANYTITYVNGTLTVNTVVVSSFNAFESTTAAGATTVGVVIQTKIAGSVFSLDVVAISGGAQSAGFTNTVKVELIPNNGTSCLTALALPGYAALSPTITGGRSMVSFAAVPDAWRDVRVRISYPAAVPTVIFCSTDNFAIRPNSLSVSVTDTDWQTAGTARALNFSAATGGNVHKAGQPFTIRATAYNAAASITGNYAGSPVAQPIACTLPTPTCTNGTLAPGTWTASGGTVTNSTASYSEAGSFNLTLQDTTFASVDSGDGTPADCTGTGYYVCSTAISVGRFVPDHFDVTGLITPTFKTFNATDAACSAGAAPRRTFTYIGQPFGYMTPPQAIIYARNTAGTITTNYSGALWKIAGTSSSSKDCLTNPNICQFTSSWTTAGVGGNISSVVESYAYTLTPASTPNWDNASAATAAATVTPGAGASIGTGTIVISVSNTLAFLRSTTTPKALFTANITDTISVTDASEVGSPVITGNGTITTTTPLVFNGTVPGSGIDFDGGGASSGNEFRYGRLKLGNAHGSELLKLPIPIQTQYWDATIPAFVINTADNCTTLATNNNIKLTTPPAGVNAMVGGAFTSGVGSLTLSPPSTAAKVAVDLCVDLGIDPVGGTVCAAATSANLPYLEGLWAPGTSYNNDPGARATFGVYKGAHEFIYQRENY
jgi:MSHA biogenesis protein MshQ